jgi:hypothetical protein
MKHRCGAWFVSIIIAEAFSVNTGGLSSSTLVAHILSPDKTTTAEDEQDRHLVNTAYSFEALMDEVVFHHLDQSSSPHVQHQSHLLRALFRESSLWQLVFHYLLSAKETEPPATPKRHVDPHPAVIRNKRVQAVVLPDHIIGRLLWFDRNCDRCLC